MRNIKKPKDSMWTDQQWDAIVSSGSNILVSAGAGSGKTAVLSERVLEIVKAGTKVTDLIVLTFTNAAAAEMKHRIREKLKKAGVGDQFVADNANMIDQSFISTFDSYCLYLVRKYNYLLGVDKQIGIIDTVTSEQVTRKLMSQVIHDEVEGGNEELIRFISTYSSQSIVEIENMLLKWYYQQKQDIIGINNLSTGEIFQTFEESIIEQKVEIENLIKEINRLAVDTNLPDKINERCEILFTVNTYDQIKQYSEYIVSEKFWAIPRTDFPDKEEVKKLNDDLKKKLKALAASTSYTKKQQLAMLEASKNAKQLIGDILNKFDVLYFEYKKENNVFEFIDINLLAIKILEENNDIAKLIRDTTHEIMIDEYQDTNDIQERFVNLIENNNVYMVGDIKQSIYGFRNANPALFASKFIEYGKGNGGKLITLSSNFRSREVILTQVNDVFGKIMSQEYGGIDYNLDQAMLYGNKSYDRLANTNFNQVITYDSTDFEIRRDDFEIFQIFKDINKKMSEGYLVVDGGSTRKIRYSDFAIICATRSNFERIVTIGEYFNISIKADLKQAFTSSNEVSVIQSMLNILNVISNNNDDDLKLGFSIMQVARSFLCNYTDLEIDESFEIYNRCEKGNVQKQLYGLLNSPLKDLVEKFNKIATNVDLKSKSYILEQITSEFDIISNLKRLEDPLTCQMRLYKLESLISDFDKRNYDLDTVCKLMNEIERNNDLDIEFASNKEFDPDSVTVITTHKSKGLEYNVCYFPFLFKKFNAMDLNDKYGYSNKFKFMLPQTLESGNLTSSIEKTMNNKLEKQELISEKIRLLYVALTRAKDKNILLIDTKGFEDGKFNSIDSSNSFNDFIFNSFECYKSMSEVAKDLTKQEIDTIKYNKFNVKQSNEQLSQEKLSYQKVNIEIESFEKVRASGQIKEIISSEVAKNIELGNSVHEKLEYCELMNIKSEIYKNDGVLKQALVNIDKSNLLTDMINYYPEFTFTYTNDEKEINGIIDLLVETDDKLIVVDYKLYNIEKDEYIKQVMTYVNYLQSISNKQVEGHLLSLLTGNTIKVY